MIPIQTTITGYSGKPCTLFSAYDEEGDVLVVTVEADYRRERRENCMVITNDDKLERDYLFKEETLQAAIEAFFSLYGGMAADSKSSRLVFNDKAMRSNPSKSIEKDGVDVRGQKYRLAETISCAEIAALATCWYADNRPMLVNNVLSMADRIISIEAMAFNGVFTI